MISGREHLNTVGNYGIKDSIVKRHSKSEANKLLGIPESTIVTEDDVRMIENFD